MRKQLEVKAQLNPKTPPIKKFLKKHKIKLLLVLILFLGWWFCLPTELFDDPNSTVVESREGQMLGARIADDGQWRFPEIDSVPYRFEESLLLFEDEYFYQHPGFNPISMGKALWENNTTQERRGGSTLTQQVIRLSRKNQPRTYWEKLIETIQATRLEARFSKKNILNLYASHAPFGGNVVGLSTASWRYFGLPPSELSWGQAAALAVLPNAPSLIFPGKNEKILKKKRDGLLQKLFQKEVIDRTTYELAIAERLPGKPLPLPDIAPHLTEKARKEHHGQRIETTIDYALQQKANRIAARQYSVLRQNEIHNLAILVLDVKTRQVLAYVGNSPTTRENDKYVDIIGRSRSTGSILKPFLFAAILDAGEILPNTLVADIPISINGYSPQNYDKQYNGAVPASLALARSLNIPAVRMLRKYGLSRFYKKLQQMNQFAIDKPADYYGLPIILGGAESSLWDVTKGYAGMASTLNFFNENSSQYREHEFMEPVYVKREQVNFGKTQFNAPVFHAGGVYKSLNTIKNLNRPAEEENWAFFENSQPIAWKTGTSFGFKDAWAVGVTSRFAIGVWAGNADGEGRPGLTGIQAAAPILFDVLSELPQTEWFAEPYDDLVEAEVCKKSGYLAGLYCDETATEWIPKNGMKTKTCPFHQEILLDASESYRVNSSCYPLGEMVKKRWFSLPPVMEYYYAPLHPEYKPMPPFDPSCLQGGEQLMEFIFPKNNESIVLPKNFAEQEGEVVFKLAHRSVQITVYWYLDRQYVGKTETFHELSLTPTPGKHVLTVVDQLGNELREQIEIRKAS